MIAEIEKPIIDALFEVIKKVAEIVVAEGSAARILGNTGEYQESKHMHIHMNSGKRIRFNE